MLPAPPAPSDVSERLLDDLWSILVKAASPDTILKSILDEAIVRTNADRGVLVEVTPRGSIEFNIIHRFNREDLPYSPQDFSRAILNEVVRSGKAMVIPNAVRDPRFMKRESVHNARLISLFCMPICVESRVAAVIHLEKNIPSYFNEEHATALQRFGEVAARAMEALQTSRKIETERDRLRVEVDQSRRTLSEDLTLNRLVGRSQLFLDLIEEVSRAIRSELPVLITGETGTGKTLIAKLIHYRGPRKARTFTEISLPDVPKELFESTIFGSVRGSYTGATQDQPGLVNQAEGGTLFLDEIGDLSLDVQSKLLRLCEENTYRRVGDTTERSERRANVRIITATNSDLKEAIRTGAFRTDLYGRLMGRIIHVPPLRDHREDIPLLLRHFLDAHEAGHRLEIQQDAADLLISAEFDWPGNVRTVRILADRIADDVPSGLLGASDLLPHLRKLIDEFPPVSRATILRQGSVPHQTI